ECRRDRVPGSRVETLTFVYRIATDPTQLILQCASKFPQEFTARSVGGMLNYLKKFAMDILPSVAATIIGAYIVNHYIATKSPADAPAAVVSTAETKPAEPQGAPKVVAAKPADASTDVANVPEAGVTAKGVSERAMIEKTAAERPAETKPVDAKSAEIKPVDTANLPTDPHHRALQPREKAVAKVTPAPVAGPVIATPVAAASL